MLNSARVHFITMIEFVHTIRVRYADTDRMGYVYYGRYAEYLESARTEMIRSWGISYREMEESGILLPVIEFNIKFLKPAYYDDVLSICCRIDEIPQMKLRIWNEVNNEGGEMIAEGLVVLAFIDRKSMKPLPAGGGFLSKLNEAVQKKKLP